MDNSFTNWKLTPNFYQFTKLLFRTIKPTAAFLVSSRPQTVIFLNMRYEKLAIGCQINTRELCSDDCPNHNNG